MSEEFIISNGLIADKVSDLDYEFAGQIDEKNLPTPKHAFKDVWYNQNDVSQNSCTLHACLGAFTNLTGYIFTIEERKKLWEEAKKKGASDNWGWYLADAMKLVVDYVNTLGKGKFVYVRTAFGSDPFYSAIKKGYSGVGSYNGNDNYNQDINDDGIVQETKLVGDRGYSHAIQYYWNNYVGVLDNYKGSTSWKNAYKLENEVELYKSGVINPSVWFIIEDVPEVDFIIDKKLQEKCKGKFIAVTKTYDGSKASGEIFYCNKNAELYTMNSAGYDLKYQMLKDAVVINVAKEELANFTRVL